MWMVLTKHLIYIRHQETLLIAKKNVYVAKLNIIMITNKQLTGNIIINFKT